MNEALSRGQRDGKRRCSNEEMVAEREKERLAVKQEESVDDLFSLCGHVEALAVKSAAAGVSEFLPLYVFVNETDDRLSFSESEYQFSNQPSTDPSSSRRTMSSRASATSGRYVGA